MRIQEDDFTALIKNGESVCSFVLQLIFFLSMKPLRSEYMSLSFLMFLEIR